MFVGSAPMPPQIMVHLRVILGIPIQEGYGLSETAAPAVMQIEQDVSTGNVGVPFANCEYKLFDVPEMGYMSSNEQPQGEIGF